MPRKIQVTSTQYQEGFLAFGNTCILSQWTLILQCYLIGCRLERSRWCNLCWSKRLKYYYWLGSLEIARRRFWKFNSKYIESIKIARPTSPPCDTNFKYIKLSQGAEKYDCVYLKYLSSSYISHSFIQVSSRWKLCWFYIFFDNIMPTTSCNSNIVLHWLTIVAWAHTRTIDFAYTYK